MLRLVWRALARQRSFRHLRLLEFEDCAAHDFHGFGRRHHRTERVTQAANRSRVQLRDARLIDADLRTDLLHRRLAVVVKADDLLLTGGQRGNGGADSFLRLLPLVGVIRLLRFRRDQRGRQRRFVKVLVVGQRRCGLDGVDSHDRSAKPLFVGSNLCREVRQGRLMAQFSAQFLASGFELPALTTHATRPGVLAEGINHRAPNTTFGERLELDPARLVEAVGRVNQTNDAVLNEIPNVDGVGHRGGNATGKLLDER